MTFPPLQLLDRPAEQRPGAAGGCRACGAALHRVPAAARFCPRCGAPLPAEAAHPPTADAARRLVAICRAERTLPAPPSAGDDRLNSSGEGTAAALPATGGFHSDVLVAYASALYRLGWRYERGRGAHRNPAEALRCYCKSARLGNVDAAARLATALPAPPEPPAMPAGLSYSMS